MSTFSSLHSNDSVCVNNGRGNILAQDNKPSVEGSGEGSGRAVGGRWEGANRKLRNTGPEAGGKEY